MITADDFDEAILQLDALTSEAGGVLPWCEAREIDAAALKETAEVLAANLRIADPACAVVCVAIGIESERRRRDRESLPR